MYVVGARALLQSWPSESEADGLRRRQRTDDTSDKHVGVVRLMVVVCVFCLSTQE